MVNLTQLKGYLLITLSDREELEDLQERGRVYVTDVLEGARLLGNGYYDLPEGWLGLTNAPGIGIGIAYGDNEENDPLDVSFDAAYYYADYQITCWVEQLLEDGWVLFKESPQTIDTHGANNPVHQVFQQWGRYPKDVIDGIIKVVTYNFGYRSSPLFPDVGQVYEVRHKSTVEALERRHDPDHPNYLRVPRSLSPLGTKDNNGIYHVIYKGRGYFKATSSTFTGWWGTKNEITC